MKLTFDEQVAVLKELPAGEREAVKIALLQVAVSHLEQIARASGLLTVLAVFGAAWFAFTR